VSTAVRLWERWAPGRVAALTSRDDELSSQSVIDRFNEGELQIIAATTVIETGINLAQLHQMVIITPERHGLTGLHQLRGRLCREGGDGHCALVCPDPITDAQRARLGLFARTQDGFALADIDLAMRGPGDIRDLSDLQSGALHGCVYGAKLSMLDLTDAMAVLDAVSASTPPIARRRCS
jgi:ATP-dependent DNA helicase RecG